MNAADDGTPLSELLRWAARGQGWNLREYPPQRVQLPGGCELTVVVPLLWRGRRCDRPSTPCKRVAVLKRRAG